MFKLVSAEIGRLLQSKLFYLAEFVMIAIAVFISLMLYADMRQGYFHVIDHGMYFFMFYIGIILAVFVSLFLGTEYDEGTLRNKVIAGHTRGSIYAAYLIVCILQAAALAVTYMIVYLAIAVPLLQVLVCSEGTAVLIFWGCLFTLISYVSVYVLISVNCTKKATTAVMCILVSLFLFFSAIYLQQKLAGAAAEPGYLSAAEEKVCQFLFDILPGGQGMQLAGLMAEKLSFSWRWPVYSAIICLITSCVGILMFRKKDLK